jgi:transcriptional regulator with XRE-family HTH domain
MLTVGHERRSNARQTLGGQLVIGRREIKRRQEQLRIGIGHQIRESREEASVSRKALATAAGIDPSYLFRIERGVAAATLDVLVSLSAGLGSDLSVRLFPTAGPRLRDHLQAPMIEALLRRLHERWTALPELPVIRARGVIDLALRQGGLAIACEAHSELRSIDLVVRRLREKTLALAELEGHGSETSSLLLLRSTARTRDLARLHEATLRAVFPARSSAVVEALTGPTAAWPGAGIAWVRLEAGKAQVLDEPPRGVRLGR